MDITLLTQKIGLTDVQMVEIPEVVIPVRRIKADMFLTNLKTQKKTLETALADVNAKIIQLETAGVKEIVAIKPIEPIEVKP